MKINAPNKNLNNFLEIPSRSRKNIPERTTGSLVSDANAKKIPERKFFSLKCKFREINIKNIDIMWAKYQVVPTTDDQK